MIDVVGFILRSAKILESIVRNRLAYLQVFRPLCLKHKALACQFLESSLHGVEGALQIPGKAASGLSVTLAVENFLIGGLCSISIEEVKDRVRENFSAIAAGESARPVREAGHFARSITDEALVLFAYIQRVPSTFVIGAVRR